MARRALLPILLVLALLVIIAEQRHEHPSQPLREGCLHCHDQVGDPDPAHAVSGLGCAVCHLGNPYSLDKKRAHASMLLQPGNLRTAGITCGRSGCHPEIVSRVKQGLMATNAGILRRLHELWPQRAASASRARTVTELLEDPGPWDRPEELYRKLCGGCHLWKPLGEGRDEISLRGGGCSDCHVVSRSPEPLQPGHPFTHPAMGTRIPSENCIRCHNRSGRIGLSYMGRWESAGYGTPYEDGDFSLRRLSGGRFYLELPADVHHRKGGMDCIDCHTATGLMGDGNRYEAMAQQVDIGCEDCHAPRLRPLSGEDALAGRLIAGNRKVPHPGQRAIAWTRRGTPLYHVQDRGGQLLLYRKRDGRPLPLDPASAARPYHILSGHERLGCQACHSPWMPQCYGCHLTRKAQEKQGDWLLGRWTPGRWEEARSYTRFWAPALGLRRGGKIYPISP